MNAFGIERGHDRLQIVAHQIKLVLIVFIAGMNRNLRWRQSKNQPAVTRINMMKPQNVFEECAVGVRILTVNDYVRSIDHDFVLTHRVQDFFRRFLETPDPVLASGLVTLLREAFARGAAGRKTSLLVRNPSSPSISSIVLSTQPVGTRLLTILETITLRGIPMER